MIVGNFDRLNRVIARSAPFYPHTVSNTYFHPVFFQTVCAPIALDIGCQADIFSAGSGFICAGTIILLTLSGFRRIARQGSAKRGGIAFATRWLIIHPQKCDLAEHAPNDKQAP